MLIPAHNEGDRVAQTVRSALRLPGLRRLIVVDDGSEDDTALRARRMGAQVVRMGKRQGKGAAVRRGLRFLSDCPFILLIDADLGDTASEARHLLRPVVGDVADVAIGRFGRVATGSGFGIVKAFARAAVRSMAAVDIESVLSGQRSLSRRALNSLTLIDDGYGLETGMTIDLLRAGMRICEVDVAMAHRDRGRDIHGFLHRGRQLVHILSAVAGRVWSQ